MTDPFDPARRRRNRVLLLALVGIFIGSFVLAGVLRLIRLTDSLTAAVTGRLGLSLPVPPLPGVIVWHAAAVGWVTQ